MENFVLLSFNYELNLFDSVVTSPDPADGVSICPDCGAKYVGKQDKCTNIVPYITYKGYWGTNKEKLKNINKLEPHQRFQKFSRTYYSECNSSTNWDLQESANRYERFNQFQQSLHLYITHMKEFKHLLNEEALEAIKDTLPERMHMAERRLSNIEEALNEIANKMHMAGQNLTFGGY